SHVFFFFQAEDGIRDFHVTGVQTCALPICSVRVLRAPCRPTDASVVPAPRRHRWLLSVPWFSIYRYVLPGATTGCRTARRRPCPPNPIAPADRAEAVEL